MEHSIKHLTCFASLDFHKTPLVSTNHPILSTSKHHFINSDHFTDDWSFICISSPILQKNWKIPLNNLPY